MYVEKDTMLWKDRKRLWCGLPLRYLARTAAFNEESDELFGEVI